ncbi:MAG: hypothetical protein RLZZ431_699 [Bacteroidota bacterium]
MTYLNLAKIDSLESIVDIEKNPYQHSLDYNTIFYYPKNIYFDFSKQIADEEIGYEITSFKAL